MQGLALGPGGELGRKRVELARDINPDLEARLILVEPAILGGVDEGSEHAQAFTPESTDDTSHVSGRPDRAGLLREEHLLRLRVDEPAAEVPMGGLDQDLAGARTLAAERDLNVPRSHRRPGVPLELDRLGIGQWRPHAVAIGVDRTDSGGWRGADDHATDLHLRVDEQCLDQEVDRPRLAGLIERQVEGAESAGECRWTPSARRRSRGCPPTCLATAT